MVVSYVPSLFRREFALLRREFALIDSPPQAIFVNNPSRRALIEPNVYLISSTEGRKKWDAVASAVPKIAVYTAEAVLASAFKQISQFGIDSMHRCDLQL